MATMSDAHPPSKEKTQKVKERPKKGAAAHATSNVIMCARGTHTPSPSTSSNKPGYRNTNLYRHVPNVKERMDEQKISFPL